MHDAAKEYLKDIKVRKDALKKELKELIALEKAIKAAQTPKKGVQTTILENSGPTLKDMILNTLDSLGRGAEAQEIVTEIKGVYGNCLLYTSPSPRDRTRSRMPSSA